MPLDSAIGPALSIRNVSKRYSGKGGQSNDALLSTTIDVEHGEFISIVGPSGCGKTTLLKICSGLIEPTSGRVQYGSYGTGSISASDVGMVFQSSVLLPWRTVLQNVLLPADVMKLDHATATDRAHSLLDMMGLEGMGSKYPDQLSGGMQQRVAISRALLHDPSVILMDEPFGALDAMTREQLNILLQEVHIAQRKTVLFVTHNIQEAVFLADRVLVMCSGPGRVTAEFPVEFPRPRNTEVYLDEDFREIEYRTRQVLDHG